MFGGAFVGFVWVGIVLAHCRIPAGAKRRPRRAVVPFEWLFAERIVPESG